MQAVLITLGILGFGAILISVYVFTAAARRYVHGMEDEEAYSDRLAAEKLFIKRSGRERRRFALNSFPLRLSDGDVLPSQRRRGERRRVSA